MTILQHGVQPLIITAIIVKGSGIKFDNPWAIIALIFCFIMGMMPDLMGWLEKVIKGRYVWSWYLYWHNPNSEVYTWLGIIGTPALLHIWVDKKCHTPTGEWKDWVISAEIGLWILEIATLWVIFYGV